VAAASLRAVVRAAAVDRVLSGGSNSGGTGGGERDGGDQDGGGQSPLSALRARRVARAVAESQPDGLRRV
jgi:hypothetical protein